MNDNIKRELIAAGIRILSQHTSLIRKPDPIDEFFGTFFGTESHDRRLARQIDEEAGRALEAAKRFSVNRKFKKITQNL